VHVQQAEPEGVVGLDVELADVQEPEAKIGEPVVGRGRGGAPGRVGVAVGERQGARAVIGQAPQGQSVAVAVPDGWRLTFRLLIGM